MYATPVSDVVTRTIDQARLGRFQVRVILLCAIVAVLDGFDTQAIAFVAPVLAQEWGVNSSAFGLSFGAGLMGLTIGSLVLGPLADRVGRRTIVIWSTVGFGAFSFLTAFAPDITTLASLRFLTGLGLGGAMPNIIALTSEYAPARMRSTLVTAMFCGFPIGAVVGGVLSAPLISAYGWPSVFIAGGSLPLLVAPFLLMGLPESVHFLSSRKQDGAAVRSLLKRIDPGAAFDDRNFYGNHGTVSKEAVPVWRLLTEGRAVGTLLIWFVFFANLLTLYFLINWLPSLLLQLNLPMNRAILSIAILNGAGVVGGISIGWWLDRRSPLLILGTAYALAALSIGALSSAGESVGITMLAIASAGLFVIGSQFGMNALAAAYYPTVMRASGVGWALGIGRIGSIVGPVLGGYLLAQSWNVNELLLLSALPSALATIAVAALYFAQPAVSEGRHTTAQKAVVG